MIRHAVSRELRSAGLGAAAPSRARVEHLSEAFNDAFAAHAGDPRRTQWVETRLVKIIHFQSVIASKAARMVLAASGKLLIDFSLRQAHGAEAGLLAPSTLAVLLRGRVGRLA